MISTQVKTHAIVTIQGAHYLVDTTTNNKLYSAGLNDMITTDDGVKIKVSNIAEVLPLTEYKKAYPKKQVYDYGQPYQALEEHRDWLELPETIPDPDRRLRVYKIMLAGFLRAQKKQDGPNVRRLIEQAQLKIKQYVPATTNS